MPPDETQHPLDIFSPLYTHGWRVCARMRPGNIPRLSGDETMERLAQGLCGLAFWAGQLQAENEKLRQHQGEEVCVTCARGESASCFPGVAQEQLRMLRTALEQEKASYRDVSLERERLKEQLAEKHAQVVELTDRNSALEQELFDARRQNAGHAEAWEKVPAVVSEELAQAQQEAERHRLSAESLATKLAQAREKLARHEALVESFASELGEMMLKRALEVKG